MQKQFFKHFSRSLRGVGDLLFFIKYGISLHYSNNCMHAPYIVRVVVTKIQLTCRLALMQLGSSIRLLRRLAWPRWGMMLGGFQGPRAANSLPKARPQRARRSAHAAVARSRRQESRRREYPPPNSSACSVKKCLKKRP